MSLPLSNTSNSLIRLRKRKSSRPSSGASQSRWSRVTEFQDSKQFFCVCLCFSRQVYQNVRDDDVAFTGNLYQRGLRRGWRRQYPYRNVV